MPQKAGKTPPYSHLMMTEYIKVDDKPKYGWRNVANPNNPEDNGTGMYYCPHVPDFIDTGYPFRRETSEGTQVKLNEEDGWEFYWDLSFIKALTA